MARDQAHRLQHTARFAGIPIYGVLNEVVADEAEKFRLDTGLEEGHIYFDRTKSFFPEKSSGAIGLLSFTVFKNTLRSLASGRASNFDGDYSYKGGVLVLGPGDQGVLYEYREDVYGELADVDAITAAIASFNPHYEFVPPSPAGSDGGDGPVNSDLADIEKARL